MSTFQIFHLIAILVIALLYSLFRIFSEPHDLTRQTYNNLIIIISAFWCMLLLFFTIIYNEKEKAINKVIRAYRGLLNNKIFLLLSDIIFVIIIAIFLYQLFMFRQVEFYVNRDVTISLNDNIGNIKFIGNLSANQNKKFRLPIGNRKLVFTDKLTKADIYSSTISVPPIWQENKLIEYSKDFKLEKEYHKTK